MTNPTRIIAENESSEPTSQPLQTELSIYHQTTVVEPGSAVMLGDSSGENTLAPSVPEIPAALSEQKRTELFQKRKEEFLARTARLEELAKIRDDLAEAVRKYRSDLRLLCHDLEFILQILECSLDDPSNGIHFSVDSHEWVLRRSALALDGFANVIDILQTLVQLPIQTNVLRHIESRLDFILDPEGKFHPPLETDQHWEEADLAESGLSPLKQQIENLTIYAELCGDIEPSSCVAQLDALVSSHKSEDDYFQGQVKIDNEHRTIQRMGIAYDHSKVEFSHQRTSDPWKFVVELFKANGSPVSFAPIFANQNAENLRKIAQTVRSTLKTIDIDVVNEPKRTSTWKAVICGCEQ